MEEIKHGYKQTDIGLIPEDWEVATLGEISNYQGGSQPDISFFSSRKYNGYIRLIQIRDYKTDKYAVYIPENLARRKCTKDDVMIGRYGPPIFQILKGIEGAYNVALIKSIPAQTVDKSFFYYTLKRDDLFQLIELLSRRSSGQTGVDLVGLKSFKIGLPYKKEQTAIATALSDIDALIAALGKKITKKQHIKQGAMQQLLTGKKRLPGFSGENKYKETEIGLIPEDWEIKNLGELGEPIIGLTYKPENVSTEGKLVLRSSNIKDTKLVFDDKVFVNIEIPEKIITRKGDILVCVRNGSRELIGKSAIINGYAIGQTFGAFMSVFRSNFNDFLIHVFNSNIIKNQIDMHLGATINQITNASLSSFIVAMPKEKSEQIAIAQILTDMDNEIARLEKERDKYVQLKAGMMQVLLTGKIRLVKK